jgi:hypothetical protein
LITSSRQKRPEPLSIQADNTLENYLLNQDTALHGFQIDTTNPSEEIDPNKIYPMPSSPVHTTFPSFQPVLSRLVEDDSAEHDSEPVGHEASEHTTQQQRQLETSVGRTLPKSRSMPWHFDDWQAAFNQTITGTNKRSNKASQHKRRSSLFAGISLTSQLVERMNEDTIAKNDEPIHLLSNSPSTSTSLHKRTSSHLASIFNGLTGLQSDGGKSQAAAEDAIAINIPTLSSISKSNATNNGSVPDHS